MKYKFGLLTAALLLLTACKTNQPGGAWTVPATAPYRVAGEPIVGERCWGIASLSVASARERPEHMAEMGTQIPLGHAVKLLQQRRNWFLVESADGYQAWLEDGTFIRHSRAEVEAWKAGPLLIVTAVEDVVFEQPTHAARPVCDVVLGNLLQSVSRQSNWRQVRLPDGRSGWLESSSVDDYETWKATRKPTPETIEQTARTLMGRPYLWGGNSPKGLDCSGFTQLVFRMHGIDLTRNSRQQSLEGTDVLLDPELKNLRKGDLLFFGRKAAGKNPERVVHVGIFLQDKLFIHSSERVQINSLDPDSPIRDEHRIHTLLRARRIL